MKPDGGADLPSDWNGRVPSVIRIIKLSRIHGVTNGVTISVSHLLQDLQDLLITIFFLLCEWKMNIVTLVWSSVYFEFESQA